MNNVHPHNTDLKRVGYLLLFMFARIAAASFAAVIVISGLYVLGAPEVLQKAAGYFFVGWGCVSVVVRIVRTLFVTKK